MEVRLVTALAVFLGAVVYSHGKLGVHLVKLQRAEEKLAD